MKKKKRIVTIVAVCLIVVAGAGTVYGINAYNNYQTEQQTEQALKQVDDTYAKFQAEKDRNKKLKILADYINNKPSTADEISVEVVNSVKGKYTETLVAMQKWFTDDYTKTIKDNTIKSDSLKKLTDKNKLNKLIDNLNALNKTISSEETLVFKDNSNGNAENYTEQSNKLINSYNDRLDAIKKEEKEKAEKEKKEKATETKTNTDNNASSSSVNIDSNSSYSSNNDNSYSADYSSGYSDNSYSSGNDSSYSSDYSSNNYDSNYNDNSYSDNNYSSGNDYSNSGGYSQRWHSYTDQYGTSYADDYGNHWDDEGNTWTDNDLNFYD